MRLVTHWLVFILIVVTAVWSITDRDIKLEEDCLQSFSDIIDWMLNGTYCNATYDGYLCWPPTPAGETAILSCPAVRLSDTTRLSYRRCGNSGKWLGKQLTEEDGKGWTNYTPCFPPEVQTLFVKVYETDAQVKFLIAQYTRYLEIGGFSVSFVSLSISLFIFSYYRSLRNNRTRIHKSLFIAMILQVTIRLTLYIDQELMRSTYGDSPNLENSTTFFVGLENMPYVCEFAYVLLEYVTSVMFMWMFIEGLYLHNLVTANALRERIPHAVYYLIGWGLPLIDTGIWAIMSNHHYSQAAVINRCWYGYNFSNLYWIVQGPRLAVIVINMVFLLNIIRVLIMKLRKSENSEVDKVRKAVRAALVLLPLLGITNAINMFEAPLDGDVWTFGVWSYGTHFLRSFQGFFIALIYCFLNGEVRAVIVKHYRNYMAMRFENRRRRESYFNFLSSSDKSSRINNREGLRGLSMRNLNLNRHIDRLNALSDPEIAETRFDSPSECRPRRRRYTDNDISDFDVEARAKEDAAAMMKDAERAVEVRPDDPPEL